MKKKNAPGEPLSGYDDYDEFLTDEELEAYLAQEEYDEYGEPFPAVAWQSEPVSFAPGGRKLLPVWKLAVIDFFCIAAGLLLFALFHHVIDLTPKSAPVALPIATPAPTPTPAPVVESAEPEPEQTEEPRPLTWAEKFADQFTDGEIVRSESEYRSANIAVSYTLYDRGDKLLYRVADVYVSDLKYLRVGFSMGEYGHSAEFVGEFIRRYQPIVALSGDYYLGRREGIVVRDGVLYRDVPDTADLCVLYDDGTMQCMDASALSVETVLEGGIRDVWTFGPTLVTGGQVMTSFNTIKNISDHAHPRSAIGYIEPGHYVFVQVDGRIAKSNGMTLAQLAALMAELGCTEAYNLDGGASSAMVWNGERVSYNYDRPLTDMIYVTEDGQ